MDRAPERTGSRAMARPSRRCAVAQRPRAVGHGCGHAMPHHKREAAPWLRDRFEFKAVWDGFLMVRRRRFELLTF